MVDELHVSTEAAHHTLELVLHLGEERGGTAA